MITLIVLCIVVAVLLRVAFRPRRARHVQHALDYTPRRLR